MISSRARAGRSAAHGSGSSGPGRAIGIDHAELDLSRPPEEIERTLDRELKHVELAAVVHAAAYTQVDQAETEPERAFAINARARGRDRAVRGPAERSARLVFHGLCVFRQRSRAPGSRPTPGVPLEPLRPDEA